MRRIIAFFKKETVLCIAAVCAILSMFAVPPDMAYLEYIDLRVLCLLFCLMAVILGMQDCGLFGLLAQKLLRGQKSLRVLLLILVGQILIVSFGGEVFRTTPISWQDWLIVIGSTSIVMWVGEIYRLLKRK